MGDMVEFLVNDEIGVGRGQALGGACWVAIRAADLHSVW